MQSPDQCSKVQGALVRIFNRMAEVEMSSCSEFDKPSQFLARVLVTKSQVGCLVGVGGATMKDMVNLTRARIQILDETDVPACASHCEKVIQASTFLEQKHHNALQFGETFSLMSCEESMQH